MHRYHLKNINLCVTLFDANTSHVCRFTKCIHRLIWVCQLLFIDIDECLVSCGAHGTCLNNEGSYVCECHEGYHIVPDDTLDCQGLYYILLYKCNMQWATDNPQWVIWLSKNICWALQVLKIHWNLHLWIIYKSIEDCWCINMQHTTGK